MLNGRLMTSVDQSYVATATGLSLSAVRTAVRKTKRNRRYRWHGARLGTVQLIGKNGRLLNRFNVRVETLPEPFRTQVFQLICDEIDRRLARGVT